MIKIKLISVNKNIDLEKEIDLELNIIRTEFNNLGIESEKYLREFISGKTHSAIESLRNSRALTESITYESLVNTKNIMSWGLGNIDYLDVASPHWYLIDVGGRHPSAGKFVPIAPAGNKRDSMVYTPYSGFGVTIASDSTIAAMGYIDATNLFIESEINRILSKH